MLIVLLLFAAVPVASAQEDDDKAENMVDVVELSLSECLDTGLTNNLDIKIAKIEALIKKEDIPLAESIFDTFLSGNINYSDDQRDTDSPLFGTKTLTTNYGLGLTKKIPTGTELAIDYIDTRTWTNRLFTETNPVHEAELSFSLRQPVMRNFFGYVDRREVVLAKIESELADIKVMDRIENSIADISKAYWEIVYEYQNVALMEQLLDEAEELYKRYEKHLTSGLVEETELYEVEANMRIRRANLIISQNDLISASNRLLLLLNEEEYFLIMPLDKLETLWGEADLVESLNEAFVSNRNYRMKKKELDGAKVTLKMKENSLWPQVDLVGTFSSNGVDRKFQKAQKTLGTSNYPYYYGGVEFSIPLDNREARSEFNKAGLRKEKGILEIMQVEKMIFTGVDEKVRDVNMNLENAKRWAKITKIQHTKFREEEKKLKYGRSTSKIVVDYQNDFFLAALREYRTILEYYWSLIDLENGKDTLLKRIGIFN